MCMCRYGHDDCEYRHAAMGQLHPGNASRCSLAQRCMLTQAIGRRAQILVRPPQPLLSSLGHLRALPTNKRLRKGPVLLQYVAHSWLPHFLRRRHRTVHPRLLRRHCRRRRPEAHGGLASRIRRVAVQRRRPMRRHGHCSTSLPLTLILFSLHAHTPRPSFTTTTPASGTAGTSTRASTS
jgi:hypothetical protein